LFDGARSRQYSDIDLLIEPGRATDAARIMEQLGFREAKHPSALRRLAEQACVAAGVLSAAHATTWTRDRDRFIVDLHQTLPLLGASAAEAWAALSTHRIAIAVVGTEVETLDRPASAMLIALHAAHHGPHWHRARADLERACAVLEPDCWRDAARLARELRAQSAMGIGLGTTDEGRALARAVGLRAAPRASDRLRWWGSARTERARAATRTRRSPLPP
jgi:hypothetical protein